MSNLYFAYSIKKEYTLPPLGHLALETSSETRKKHIRACDACAIRKTKCEETRPCRNCRNNGLECTELRERKKMGPKTLRKRTIELIHLLERHRLGEESQDLSPVADAVLALKKEAVEAVFPLTVPSVASYLEDVARTIKAGPAIASDDSANGAASDNGEKSNWDPAASAKELAHVSLGLLLLSAPSSSFAGDLGGFRDHVSLVYGTFTSRLVFLHNYPSAAHYHASLAELHMYGCFLLLDTPFSTRQLVHLRSAITHYQLIAASLDTDTAGLLELRRALYTAERSACLFATEEVFKAGCLIHIGPSSPQFPLSRNKTFVMDCVHDIFKLAEEHGVYSRVLSLPNLFLWRYIPFQNQTGVYGSIKMNAHNVAQDGAKTPFVQLIVTFISFKVLLLYAGEYSQITVGNELLEFITRTSAALVSAKTDPYFTTRISAFSLVPHLLDLLRCYFEAVNNTPPPEALDRLREYTQLIAPFCAKSAFMDAAKFDHVFAEWFSREAGDWESRASSSSAC